MKASVLECFPWFAKWDEFEQRSLWDIRMMAELVKLKTNKKREGNVTERRAGPNKIIRTEVF